MASKKIQTLLPPADTERNPNQNTSLFQKKQLLQNLVKEVYQEVPCLVVLLHLCTLKTILRVPAIYT